MVAKTASKKTNSASPAQIVIAALQRETAVKGYRRVAIEGTSGKVWITQAPDGHVFAQFTPSGNPKANVTFGSADKAKLLKSVIDSVVKAAEVVDEINASQTGMTSTAQKYESNGVRL
jgi:hypothetical protein